MKLTIGKKIGLGFSLVIMLMIISAFVAMINIRRMSILTGELTSSTFPTAVACERLMSGINQSIAALRGYMILGDDSNQADFFKDQRAEAMKHIDESLKNLGRFSAEQDKRHLASIQNDLLNLKIWQQNVEDIAQTSENVAAYKLLITEGATKSTQIRYCLDTLINLESIEIENSDRRILLKALADSRASFIASVAEERAYLLAGDKEYVDSYQSEWNRNTIAFKHLEASSHLLSQEQRPHWEQYSNLRQQFKAFAERLFVLRDAEDWNQANFILETKASPLVNQVRDAIDEMAKMARQRVEVDNEKLATAQATLNTSLLGATGIAIILAIVIACVLSRRIVTAITLLAERANAVAAGDLTGDRISIPGQDEVGDLAETFNIMTDSLRDLATQIGGVSGNIDSASSQIFAASKQQVAGTREQSATVQQVTSTMKELTQSGNQISDKANEVASSAEATAEATTSGQQAANLTNQTMDSIRQQVEEVAENIVALSEKTQTIGEIIATVNDIAEQSNLLALNASIESVSAGEQGSRFSIVANEMKNLADQAKESTVQVRGILGDIQKGINTSVMLTEEAVKRVESGKQQADMTEQTIREMGETTSRSIEAFQQIVGGASQQQIGFDQIAQGMGDINTAAEQTALSTTQLEAAASNLNALSQQLQTAVGRYRI